MARIPAGGGSVLDNLVDASQEMFVFSSGQMWLLPSFDENGLEQGIRSVITGMGLAGRVPPNEIAHLVRKMLVFQTSSDARRVRSEEHTSELQSLMHIVCRLLLEKKNSTNTINSIHNTDR